MDLFTNNPDFYPTPKEVIGQMMMGEEVTGKIILEPSAGSGNIVDWLKENGAAEVIACENDPHCRKLLADKCRLVADDFLTVTSEQVSHVDMIVMNPPFSKGVEHILHAFEIAPPGCTVIALCNANSVDEYHSYSRNQILYENIQLYGYTECLGKVFETAERKTSVVVSLVKLYKEGTGEEEWQDYLFSQQDEDALNMNETEGLVQYNVVREMVNRYMSAVKMFDEVMEMTQRINETARATDGKYDAPPIEFRAVESRDGRATTVTREEYKKQLKKYYWHTIFQMLKMGKYETQSLREQMNRFVEKQVNVPFTMGNIYRVLDMIVQTHGQRMHKALIEAFEHICSFSAENSTAGEKWKTNANYMVNRKFIIPYMCDGYDWEYTGTSTWSMARKRVGREYVEVSGSSVEEMYDVCKALCYLTGRDYNEIPTLPGRYGGRRVAWNTWFIWGFFRCKAFKKGTMHFEFLDEDVWYKFNAEVAKTKGWTLPKKSDGWQQSPSKLIPRIDKGDLFRCKKDVKYSDGTMAYRKDMVYRSEREHGCSLGFITNESGNANHAWPIYQDKGKGVDDWRDWFEKVA